MVGQVHCGKRLFPCQGALFRITQEALNNIVKHAEAKRVQIRLVNFPEKVNITVSDDGRGFNARSVSPGLGTTSMRERAEAIGATLNVYSQIGEGTTVSVSWERPASLS